jgi:hypothetical protein
MFHHKKNSDESDGIVRRNIEEPSNNTTYHGVRNKLKVHRLTFNKDADANNRVNGPGQGQEPRGQRQFEATGYGCFKNISLVDLTILERLDTGGVQTRDVFFIPPRPNNTNPHGRSVHGLERHVTLRTLTVARRNKQRTNA